MGLWNGLGSGEISPRRPALELLIGDTIDISEWLEFESMTLCGFVITSKMIPSHCWNDVWVYHIGLEVIYVIGFLARK